MISIHDISIKIGAIFIDIIVIDEIIDADVTLIFMFIEFNGIFHTNAISTNQHVYLIS